MKLGVLVGTRPLPVDVDVGPTTYTIAAAPAETWLPVLLQGSPLEVVPGMLADYDLDDQLADDPDGSLTAECSAAGRAAIAAAAGMPWWVAARLAQLTAVTWVGHELTVRGVDPTTLSLAAYLGAAYRVVTREMDEQKTAGFDTQLLAPPAGVEGEDWFDQDEAEANFLAAMSSDESQDYG